MFLYYAPISVREFLVMHALYTLQVLSCTSTGEAMAVSKERSTCSLGTSSLATTSRMRTGTSYAFPMITILTLSASRTPSSTLKTSTTQRERTFLARPAWLGTDPLSSTLSIPPPVPKTGLPSMLGSFQPTLNILERISVLTWGRATVS